MAPAYRSRVRSSSNDAQSTLAGCIATPIRPRSSRRRSSTTRRERLRMDPVPLDGPQSSAELESLGRPDHHGGRAWAATRGAEAVRRRARAGLHLGRPPALPVVHPGRPHRGVDAVRPGRAARRPSTAARGSRAPAPSTPRTRRCGGSPTSSGCPPAPAASSSRAARTATCPRWWRRGTRRAQRAASGDRRPRWRVAARGEAHSSITHGRPGHGRRRARRRRRRPTAA